MKDDLAARTKVRREPLAAGQTASTGRDRSLAFPVVERSGEPDSVFNCEVSF
jgi:hypothetical protein